MPGEHMQRGSTSTNFVSRNQSAWIHELSPLGNLRPPQLNQVSLNIHPLNKYLYIKYAETLKNRITLTVTTI